MPYNYFVCRKHAPPVRHAAPQPNNLPDTYASPACPTCGKTMARYDSGLAPQDNRPLPPDLPPPLALAALPALTVIYEGSGINPGHGLVTWKISKSVRKMTVIFDIKLGQDRGGSYDAELGFKMVDSLLKDGQAGDKKDWWVNPPLSRNADDKVWHSLDLGWLVGQEHRKGLPAKIDIGVKLGNAAFGLIHLLAGHSQAVRRVGPFSIPAERDPDDSQYVTMLALQSGMQRFEANSIKQISYNSEKSKLLIAGSHNGFIVITKDDSSSLYSITTIYNTDIQSFGDVIYPS